MNVKKWLSLVAYKTNRKQIAELDLFEYRSKFDDSYITLEGMEDNVKHLADREITEQLTHGVGYSPKECKWYGWSHRAIYGFKIGSPCRKGDCHYNPKYNSDAIEDALLFWKCDDYHGMTARLLSTGNVQLDWKYGNNTPNHSLRQRLGGIEHHVSLGSGEWTASTMGDAKQMAIDFHEGVS